MTAHIDREGDKLFFVDADGVRWRVYDAGFGPPHAKPFKRRVYELGSSRATDRIFVPKDGDRRSYHFARGDSRGLTAETLAKQLAAARLRRAPRLQSAAARALAGFASPIAARLREHPPATPERCPAAGQPRMFACNANGQHRCEVTVNAVSARGHRCCDRRLPNT